MIVTPTPEQLEQIRALIAKEEAEKKRRALEGIDLIDASSLEIEPIRWLWPGWLARGKLHILAGAPGTGKTTIAMHLAACVSAGLPFPSSESAKPGTVLIWSGEDDICDTLVPRLISSGADLDNIKFIGNVTERDGTRRAFDPGEDVPQLADAAIYLENAALIVIDPIVMAILGDSHKNAEVRRGLDPLVKLASRLDAALIGISHFSKGTQGRAPLERVTGSLGFGAIARIVYGTVRLPQEGEGPPPMMFARMKSNIGRDGGGFPYHIEEVQLRNYSGISATRIVWGTEVDGAAYELLQEEQPADGAENDATAFLRALLAEGPMRARDVLQQAAEAGYSRDQMNRAKRKLGIDPEKLGMKDGWRWALSSLEDREGSAPGESPSSRSSTGHPLPSDRF